MRCRPLSDQRSSSRFCASMLGLVPHFTFREHAVDDPRRLPGHSYLRLIAMSPETDSPVGPTKTAFPFAGCHPLGEKPQGVPQPPVSPIAETSIVTALPALEHPGRQANVGDQVLRLPKPSYVAYLGSHKKRSERPNSRDSLKNGALWVIGGLLLDRGLQLVFDLLRLPALRGRTPPASSSRASCAACLYYTRSAKPR